MVDWTVCIIISLPRCCCSITQKQIFIRASLQTSIWNFFKVILPLDR